MLDLKILTKRQKSVYEFIRDKIRNRGYGPTVREIGENFDISSPNGVMCHLKALEKKGLITREPNMSRAIQLVAEPIEERGLPLAGRIAAGVLHEAIEQNERVDFEAMFNKKNLYVLKVSGDSMIDAQIADGDFVVVRKQSKAIPGQIVVAETDEGEATLKRWYPEP
ncbi:MAG TPA: transcriptional repressor LexA, partial [Pirellulales bacterium]|nr:transcriptional repressor LexA [Pirellulales bacterium]